MIESFEPFLGFVIFLSEIYVCIPIIANNRHREPLDPYADVSNAGQN